MLVPSSAICHLARSDSFRLRKESRSGETSRLSAEHAIPPVILRKRSGSLANDSGGRIYAFPALRVTLTPFLLPRLPKWATRLRKCSAVTKSCMEGLPPYL